MNKHTKKIPERLLKPKFKERTVDLVINWWAELADENGHPKKEMYEDHVHFNSDGYDIVAKTIY